MIPKFFYILNKISGRIISNLTRRNAFSRSSLEKRRVKGRAQPAQVGKLAARSGPLTGVLYESSRVRSAHHVLPRRRGGGAPHVRRADDPLHPAHRPGALPRDQPRLVRAAHAGRDPPLRQARCRADAAREDQGAAGLRLSPPRAPPTVLACHAPTSSRVRASAAAATQASNTFKNIERGAAGSEAVADAADAPSSKPPAKRRKVQDTASAASGSTTIRLPALPGGAAAAGAAAAEAPRNFVPGFRGDG